MWDKGQRGLIWRAPELHWLGEHGFGFMSMHNGWDGGSLSFANRTTTLSPTPSLAQGASPLTLMSLVTEEHRAPSALGEDSRRK